MATFSTTATVDDPRISLGDDGVLPPVRGGGGDDGFGLPDYATRLRRARLGLLDPRTNTLVRDWIPVTLPKLLLINTGVLILSSVFMELARRQIKGQATRALRASAPGVSAGDQTRIPWLTMTLVLGLVFLFGQWTAWRQLAANGFYVATTPSSSFVYLLTGTHAIHLMGGVLALFVAGIASLLRRSVATRSIVVDVTAWYWHFMAGLWIYILCLLEFAS